MASKGPKPSSLSRYFKDLDEFDCSSDEGDEEVSNTVTNSDDKTNKLTTQNSTSNNSSVKSENHSVSVKKVSSGENANTKSQVTEDVKDNTNLANKKCKLPSALECLNTQSNPTFLKTQQKKEVNWDTCQKRLEGDADSAVLDYKSNSVPPPSSYEPITDPGIKVVDSEGRKRKTIGDELEDQMTSSSSRAYKVHKEDKDADNDDDNGS